MYIYIYTYMILHICEHTCTHDAHRSTGAKDTATLECREGSQLGAQGSD